MARFAYVARDPQRNAVTGDLERRSPDEVADHLLARGLTPIRIVKRRGRSELWKAIERRLTARPGVVDLIFFCRQMYSVTKAGVPLHRGVRSVGEAVRHPVLRHVLHEIRRRLEEGQSLSAAMAAHAGVFPSLMINLIRVGEHTGSLDRAFAELERNLELEQSARRQVAAALRYPVMVIAAVGVALAVVNLFVIPAFARVFAGFDAELPGFTRLLLASSGWTQAAWPYLLGGLLGAAVAVRLSSGHARVAELWGRWSLRIPILGSILVKATLARLLRTLAMCLRAGIAVDQALQAVAGATGNRYYALRLAALRERISKGESLAAAARRADLFTPLVMQIVATGEETGRLDEMLDEAADFYEHEVEYDVKRLGDYIEPLLLIVVSVLVLVLALGIFLPMWDFGQAALSGR